MSDGITDSRRGSYFNKIAYPGKTPTINEEFNVSKKEYEQIKAKADKWDELESQISKLYLNKDGEYDQDNPEMEGDLLTIGEMAATALGWL